MATITDTGPTILYVDGDLELYFNKRATYLRRQGTLLRMVDSEHAREFQYSSITTPSAVDAESLLLAINEMLDSPATGINTAHKPVISRFMDTVGDGSGTKNAIANFAADTPFKIQPAAGEVYRISRLVVNIETSSPLRADRYGSVALGAGEGMRVVCRNDSGEIIDYTDGLRIISSANWARYCYDVSNTDFGAGNNYIDVRWTFAKSGQPLRLRGDNNERLEVICKGNLSGLTSHYLMAQGFID